MPRTSAASDRTGPFHIVSDQETGNTPIRLPEQLILYFVQNDTYAAFLYVLQAMLNNCRGEAFDSLGLFCVRTLRPTTRTVTKKGSHRFYLNVLSVTNRFNAIPPFSI